MSVHRITHQTRRLQIHHHRHTCCRRLHANAEFQVHFDLILSELCDAID